MIDQLRDIAQNTRDALVKLDQQDHRVCCYVRKVIQRCNSNAEHAFPHNWCDFASFVLGRRIARLTSRTDIMLCKWDEEGTMKQHWWLRVDDIDIDITADQFADIKQQVIVAQSSSLHAEHFPDPSCTPIFARQLQTNAFERAVLTLDFALSD
ncbi:MAG: hypothetical protein ACR2GY_07100, partial [Phycisphaerales bacterium]